MNHRINYHTLLIATVIAMVLFTACSGTKHNNATGLTETVYQPDYASGFTICLDNDSIGHVIVRNPWQGADSVTMDYRAEHPAQRIVAMSSTYVAMLESLDAIDRVVGVSGRDFISSEALRSRGDKVADVGYDTNIDFEKLVILNPDLVLLYGVSGPNLIEEKLKELNIPYMYMGEYVEESPLGKAEWVVAIGELIGKRDRAEALFDSIANRYNNLRNRYCKLTDRPKVMLNAPYNDSWWMPSAKNYMARLIEDAGGDYTYKKNEGNASVAIDIEEAYMLMSEADVWLNPGQATSLREVSAMTPRFTDTKPFNNGEVWNNNGRSTRGGGNDFYESGIMHPDIILEDLADIFHRDSLSKYEPMYYQRLK